MSEAAMKSPAMKNPWAAGARAALPMGVVGLIGVMIVPLPATALDLLISLNVALSMVVLLTAVYIERPVNFSVFPSALLLLTIFRLGLNIASTRRILLHGNEGTSAAGSVIEAFGEFVVGGNLVVGVVIFLVLLAIQFIVINHGATRISEVAARFTLDAMPGKQMAIDADLNAGLIDEVEAKERRKVIQEEADFYGSMDGAVRFTQRDAVASILIVGINIIAGLIIGIVQSGMGLGEALRTFSTLTVGDGLVTAIPSLLISVAGGLVTTRNDTGDELGGDIAGQLFANPKPLTMASATMATMALIPGLPTVAFLSLAGGLGALAFGVRTKQKDIGSAEPVEALGPPPEEPIEPLLTVDPLTVEVGYDLVEMAGSDRPGGLLERIRGIRRQIALDQGMVVPPVRVRDNLRLGSDEYLILLRGAEIGRARLPRGTAMAIDPGDALEKIEGQKTIDPAFGIEAQWIPEEQSEHARGLGYTVVDRVSVIGTHLSELVRGHAPELMGRQETQHLLDNLAKTAPKLVEELVPERFTVGGVQKVLQALLRERVSIRDLQTICEAMADGGNPQDMQTTVATVRRALGRSLVRPLMEREELKVITVSGDIERQVHQLLNPQEGAAPLDPRFAQTLVHRIATALREVPSGGQPVVLCGSAESRAVLRKLSEHTLATVPFLSVNEIPDGVQVTSVGQVQ